MVLVAPMQRSDSGSVRRQERQRTAAAEELSPFRKSRDDKHDEPHATFWAHAVVFGTRTIIALPRENNDGRGGLAGTVWTVREVDTRHIPGSRGPRCLVYENSEIVRRVWLFPTTWVTLSADELLRLAAIT
jgi:hypothetical protein